MQLQRGTLQKPSDADLQGLLAPVAGPMMAVSSAADAGRRAACFHHLKALAETAQALGWLAYTGPTCGETRSDGSEGASYGSNCCMGPI